MIYDNYSEKNYDDVTECDEGDVITVMMMLMAMSMVPMRRMMKMLVTLM